MSTTFGIEIASLDDEEKLEAIEIAFRSSSYIRWINPLGPALDPDTPVVAIDNSPQGIYTVGDIIQEIENYNQE